MTVWEALVRLVESGDRPVSLKVSDHNDAGTLEYMFDNQIGMDEKDDWKTFDSAYKNCFPASGDGTKTPWVSHLTVSEAEMTLRNLQSLEDGYGNDSFNDAMRPADWSTEDEKESHKTFIAPIKRLKKQLEQQLSRSVSRGPKSYTN